MSNNQLFPFERNRYYVGKMLTSSDFLAEQTYFNNKRRFFNHIMFGSGIICGMSVFNLDDLSVMIESGAAIDGYGREIIIDQAVVKKLSAIEGFEKLESDRASLCVRYKESPVHPVYAVNKPTGSPESPEGYEYNRISEGYELFLIDSNSVEHIYEMEQEFLTQLNLAEGNGYTAELSVPVTVCKAGLFNIQLKIRKKNNENSSFRLKCELQTPAFLTEQGTHELCMDTGLITLAEGEEVFFEYNLQAQGFVTNDTGIVVKPDTLEIYENDKKIETELMGPIKVNISASLPDDLITREVGKLSLEMQNMAGVKEYIRLADFKLVRTGSAYLIESVEEEKAKSYIQTPAQAERRNEYRRYFSGNPGFGRKQDNQNTCFHRQENAVSFDGSPMITTGIVEIPFEDRMRKGSIRYSGEIMHGLGKGNVYVTVGFECMGDDKTLGKMTKSTIYGNPNLFQEKSSAVNVETAVKVLNEKGSFVVAARLLKDTQFVMLTLRWVAIKADSGGDISGIENYTGKSISAEKTTVVLGTGESYYFNVRFNNMEPCGVTYELTEPYSGEITLDGVYTAPAKEGVYEIRIFCTNMPIICTYAYAVVRKNTGEKFESQGAADE